MRASVARTAYFDAPGGPRQPDRSARRRSSTPQPRHFAAREDGGVIPLVAVSRPLLTDVQITNFAVEAVTAAMTMDFANWRGDLSEASDCTAARRGLAKAADSPSEAVAGLNQRTSPYSPACP